jgi:hypothetical protein
MPITATVIGDLRVQAVLAAHDMAAESHRAAALDRRHHLQLAETDVTCIGLPPSRSMVAEDIRDLQGMTSHDRRGLCRRLLLRCQRREPIQRAHDRADHVGGHLRIERGRIKPGMSEQNLDQTHIGFLFKQVGGKAVAQCVRRHWLLDRRPIGSGMNGAIELPRRQRQQRITARERGTVRNGWYGRVSGGWLWPYHVLGTTISGAMIAGAGSLAHASNLGGDRTCPRPGKRL